MFLGWKFRKETFLVRCSDLIRGFCFHFFLLEKPVILVHEFSPYSLEINVDVPWQRYRTSISAYLENDTTNARSVPVQMKVELFGRNTMPPVLYAHFVEKNAVLTQLMSIPVANNEGSR